MKSPHFSIIIPVKGRFHIATQSIDSVYKQEKIDKSSIEIIVVEERDYGENIRYKLHQLYPEIKTLVNNDEKYSGGSRNTGLSRAHGDYIVFLDSDDQLKPTFLYHMSNELDKNPNLGCMVCLSDTKFQSPFTLPKKLKLFILMLIRDVSLYTAYFLNNGNLFPSAFYLCQISHMMFRSQCIKKLQFNADYKFGGEDWDFFAQVTMKTPIKILPKLLTIFRYSEGSSTTDSEKLFKKWSSYSLLANRLPYKLKGTIYYKFFLYYIKLFATHSPDSEKQAVII